MISIWHIFVGVLWRCVDSLAATERKKSSDYQIYSIFAPFIRWQSALKHKEAKVQLTFSGFPCFGSAYRLSENEMRMRRMRITHG